MEKNNKHSIEDLGSSSTTSLQDHPSAEVVETWLWNVACAIRGPLEAQKFKDHILHLIFYKRLSDTCEDAIAELGIKADEEEAYRPVFREIELITHERRLTRLFYIPRRYRWNELLQNPHPYDLGRVLNEAMHEVAQLIPELQGVIDLIDYNKYRSGQYSLDNRDLAKLLHAISSYRLGFKDVESETFVQAYEHLQQRFAEAQGKSAGAFYTPEMVSKLLARLLNPEKDATVYDPACGSANLLTHMYSASQYGTLNQGNKAPKIYGQERDQTILALAKINAILHGYTEYAFVVGDTLRRPLFMAEGTTKLQQFKYVVSNPPWNQNAHAYEEIFRFYEDWHRFRYGVPPKSSADWAWMQHILASLEEGGRAAVVLDTGAVIRGSGSKVFHREKEVRRAFVEEDLIESIILLPKNLFFNTTEPGVILILNLNKPSTRKHQILLVNASILYKKKRRKNVLTDEGITAVVEVYKNWETREKFSKIITLHDVRIADYNLNPSDKIMLAETTTPKIPKAFISYSWDSDGHRKWVHDFAARLRRDGVDVLLDQWHVAPGDHLADFMERAVRDNDFVLIICTPRYKEKSDGRIGGVGYEGNVMTSEVLTTRNHRKFIPILRDGEWQNAAPSWISGKYYLDLRGEEYVEENYQDLLQTLHGLRLQAPPIGDKRESH